MHRRFPFLLVALLAAAFVFSGPAAAQEPRQVWAYYFGWYTGESWADGRLLDRPAAPYDSRDGGAVSRQISEAQSAGIDAFITAWYGPANGNLTSQTFNMLLDISAGMGFRAGAAVDLADPGYNATPGDTIATLSYLIGDRANHPAYLRYNGKPVIYFWNQGRFSVNDWRAIRDQVDPGRGTIWVAEGTDTSFLAVFDGLYLFNTAWAANPGAVATQWMRRTQQAGGTFYTPTVLPGWDESALAAGRPNPTSPRARNNGQFLTASWNGAVSSGAGAILIVSWNEYLENSHIEPSQVYGSNALDTLRPLIAAWKGGGAGAAVAAAGGAPGSPTGVSYSIHSNLRLRTAPGGEVIATVPATSTVDVVGRVGDSSWVQVNYAGQSGWVAVGYGTFMGDLNAVPVTG